MDIFIDESGIFSNPQGKEHLASVVAALVIPTCKKRSLLKRFNRLTHHWNLKGQEVKGRELDENQITAIVTLLKRYDTCVYAFFIDLGFHTDDEITKFKLRQADAITASLTPEHQPSLIRQAEEIREVFIRMSNPIFVQAFLMMGMIPKLVPLMAHYYARRIPKELRSFHWVVDAKQEKLTEFEKAWSQAVYPIMSTISLKEPFGRIEGGDYSYMDRYEQKEDEETLRSIREWAESNNPELKGEKINALDLSMILGESFKFEDSKKDKGLQLVDVIANGIQRALNNKLQEKGWREIGSLMISKNPYPMEFIRFNTNSEAVRTESVRSPFYHVVETLKQESKMLWTDADAPSFEKL